MKKSTLVTALFLLAASGLMLHLRIHFFMVPDKLHPGEFIFDSTKLLASLLPLIDVIVVTALFISRRTAVYGYLLNGLIVIYGSILMAHYSIAEIMAKSIPFPAMLLKSTLPDIGIAWADFLVGKALYDLHMKKPGERQPGI
ncbi:MAG: hypothetical protein HZA15_08725 [Nitrospirae bacterium]|nr:hypothetical protein [Nitrospirota bacterium]